MPPRPRLSRAHRRALTIRFRCTPEEDKSFKEAAQALGLTLSEWLRLLARLEAHDQRIKKADLPALAQKVGFQVRLT